ncbi:RNA polymerase sigma factor sigA isoform X1 [Dendrobium catenatum]|uniref:RNA polymerase sigma factor sigA n=1 Tax=Dendrobium catenatum TaxID=906689 RepID=A0A2I0WIQ2_9ASPA|nr:RNA polymerase sigma factor sigA isoform X1 [Dendrobium catenatum]XP_020685444.1 RNA polymerase sigma factor sigA isoform X1 [Dendrobium catenatum]PKU75540.1 RNA polymerase sigma factor sigA [Dendrobium catenatum]
MMVMAAVVGLAAGKRLLRNSFYSSDFADKFFPDHGATQPTTASSKSVIFAQKPSNFGMDSSTYRHTEPIKIKALMTHIDTSAPSATDNSFERLNTVEDHGSDIESSLEVLILLQKSMLEKQWELSFNLARTVTRTEKNSMTPGITRSGISAQKRRADRRRKFTDQNVSEVHLSKGKQHSSVLSAEFLQTSLGSYVRGTPSEALLRHSEVVHLSRKIKIGLLLEEQKMKLKERLGFEPSDKQLAFSLKMSCASLRSKLMECSLATEKLAMSNVRLVMSIAQKYDNLGSEMADLVQGGLIGLLRGIEKFDSSKGCKISTYVYWWIRQGVSRTLAENSRTLRLPTHLHERLSSIHHAKIRLQEKGITPSIDNIAESLNISTKKVRNATQAISRVVSLDREAFPSLNGLPGDTLHSYIADNNLDNNPWHGFEEWSLKDEVHSLLSTALNKRERDIICSYYGLDKASETWEDIGKQFGLSRERVRQVGLVAMEKLKHAARRKKLEAMLIKH